MSKILGGGGLSAFRCNFRKKDRRIMKIVMGIGLQDGPVSEPYQTADVLLSSDTGCPLLVISNGRTAVPVRKCSNMRTVTAQPTTVLLQPTHLSYSLHSYMNLVWRIRRLTDAVITANTALDIATNKQVLLSVDCQFQAVACRLYVVDCGLQTVGYVCRLHTRCWILEIVEYRSYTVVYRPYVVCRLHILAYRL